MKEIRPIVLMSLLALILCNACTKGKFVDQPSFGLVSMEDFTGKTISIIRNDASKFIGNSAQPGNAISGLNRFRFYEGTNLLLDTALMVEPFEWHRYVMFKPNENTPLRIYDSALNNFDKETLPDSGFVKFSLANFAPSFPGKVNIAVSTTTLVDFRPLEVIVGQYDNVSTAFSQFRTLGLGNTITQFIPEHTFKLIVKDPLSGVVLTTATVKLPGKKYQSDKDLPYQVYLIYIDDKNGATILMNK